MVVTYNNDVRLHIRGSVALRAFGCHRECGSTSISSSDFQFTHECLSNGKGIPEQEHCSMHTSVEVHGPRSFRANATSSVELADH
jgi:hypothetical protein